MKDKKLEKRKSICKEITLTPCQKDTCFQCLPSFMLTPNKNIMYWYKTSCKYEQHTLI